VTRGWDSSTGRANIFYLLRLRYPSGATVICSLSGMLLSISNSGWVARRSVMALFFRINIYHKIRKSASFRLCNPVEKGDALGARAPERPGSIS